MSIELVRQPSVQQAGIVSVSVPKGTTTSGTGFSFPLPVQVAATAGVAPVKVTLPDGAPLPAWLRYVPETKSFVATAVPDGAFPIQVVVIVGGVRSTIVISERAQD